MYQRRFLIFYCIILFVLNSCNREKSSNVNFNFEIENFDNKENLDWNLDNFNSYYATTDPNIAYEGVRSLRLEYVYGYNNESDMGVAFLDVGEVKKNQNVKFSGYIKTVNTTSDSLGLFIHYRTRSKNVFKVVKSDSLVGNHDWEKYQLEINITEEPLNFIVGVCLFGKGKIWVDNLELNIGGEKKMAIHDNKTFVASRKERKWLKRNCIAIKTCEAENGFEDLVPLKVMIGDARIIALGENTHGSSEVFKMKHRLVEYLCSELGFTIFAIEANMPEAYELNNYILHGEGDSKELLKGMYFWTWKTQEVLDMIEWMRKFNKTGKGVVQFTGFDMQFHNVALENIRKYASDNDQILNVKLDSLSTLFERIGPMKNNNNKQLVELSIKKCKDILSYFVNNKDMITNYTNKEEYDWLKKNADILLQCSIQKEKVFIDYIYRDSCMAENVKWILNKNPQSKIILWAHNGHIEETGGRMGGFLKKEFGDDYYNIGFLSNSGTYTACNQQKELSNKNQMNVTNPGSFEYSFHKTGLPCFYFDFKLVNKNIEESKWLTKTMDYRNIGAMAMTNEFEYVKLSKLYDAIIYIDSTTASECFALKR